jgi:AcrR family transcriptional regulator
MTKEKILKIAKSEFSKKGYENTSLDTVAKKLGLSKAAIYYYFNSKKALYNAIFTESFKGLTFFVEGDSLKDIENYIEKTGEFFKKDKEIAKLFAMELANGMIHLNDETLKIMSKLLKTVVDSLKGIEVNPFFLQTVIISSLVTYSNTIRLRERVSSMVKCKSLNPEFDIIEELKLMITNYLKAKK